MPPTFLRRNTDSFSRLGKNKRKKQVWRSPKGRHNKMRLKRKGYPSVVSIGYKTEESKKMILVNSPKELEKIGKEDMIIVGKVGNRKRTEIVNKAKEKGIKIQNINLKKFTKKMNKEKQEKSSTEKKETTKTETKK
ncbi:MAG: 50S ribosomal protein L32e [Candidatus Pacearchaeota archaeon]|nr:50S ribosomal protein L32e [Candidatus Pacearchaeota archaeon]